MSGPYDFRVEDAYRFGEAVGIETKRKGNELHFKYCPYCKGGKNRDTDTFAINLETGKWNCKRGSCERKGNMITLVQDFAEFSLGDGIDDYYLKRERFRKFLRKTIVVKDAAIQYMESRGIPEWVTRKYEITMKKDSDNVMLFPFADEKDDVWFIKYRNITYEKGVTAGSKEWCEKDRKPILFGMNHCNFENHTLVMTEGQIDSLSLAAAGIENAVSVPLGKNGFTWIPYCVNFLGRFDELIIFGDYENGEISLLDGMKTRFHGKVKHVRPEDYRDCKDANEILQKYGKEGVRQCVANAVPIPVPGLKRFRDVQRIRLADRERMETGIAEIDRQCGFYFGELIILTGAAGDGKSTMASQWATKALDQGYSVMIYSGEMESGTVKDWLILQMAGSHNLNLSNDITYEVAERITNWEASDRLYIYDAESFDTDNEQRALFESLKLGIQQYGIRFIVIDNMMTVMDYNTGLELNEAQTVFTRRLASLAQNSGVIIVLIVHPRKGKAGSFSNDDIAGSSNIVNRAHKTIRYARPEEKFTDRFGRTWEKDDLLECPHRTLTVLKDRVTGNTLRKGVTLYFEKPTKRISDDGKFNWKLGWENDGKDSFIEAEEDDLDIIPF